MLIPPDRLFPQARRPQVAHRLYADVPSPKKGLGAGPRKGACCSDPSSAVFSVAPSRRGGAGWLQAVALDLSYFRRTATPIRAGTPTTRLLRSGDALRHSRPLRVPHALQPGRAARGPRHPRRRTAASSRRDPRAIWRRSPSTTTSSAARRRGSGSITPSRPVRHRAALGGECRRVLRPHRRGLATPEFRPRALFERFSIEAIATTESPLDPLSTTRRSAIGLERAGGHGLSARSGGRSRIRRLRRQPRALRRAHRRGHRDLERLSRGASQAPRLLQERRRDLDRSRPPDRQTADLSPGRRRGAVPTARPGRSRPRMPSCSAPRC